MEQPEEVRKVGWAGAADLEAGFLAAWVELAAMEASWVGARAVGMTVAEEVAAKEADVPVVVSLATVVAKVAGQVVEVEPWAPGPREAAVVTAAGVAKGYQQRSSLSNRSPRGFGARRKAEAHAAAGMWCHGTD